MVLDVRLGERGLGGLQVALPEHRDPRANQVDAHGHISHPASNVALASARSPFSVNALPRLRMSLREAGGRPFASPVHAIACVYASTASAKLPSFVCKSPRSSKGLGSVASTARASIKKACAFCGMPSSIAARAGQIDRMNAACVRDCSKIAQASAGMCMSRSSSDVGRKPPVASPAASRAAGGDAGHDLGGEAARLVVAVGRVLVAPWRCTWRRGATTRRGRPLPSTSPPGRKPRRVRTPRREA